MISAPSQNVDHDGLVSGLQLDGRGGTREVALREFKRWMRWPLLVTSVPNSLRPQSLAPLGEWVVNLAFFGDILMGSLEFESNSG
jgi:hypothetical protein